MCRLPQANRGGVGVVLYPATFPQIARAASTRRSFVGLNPTTTPWRKHEGGNQDTQRNPYYPSCMLHVGTFVVRQGGD
ncbi:hypothetical protein P171DRAFT_222600 [Karstenula rhodostoma CBS 690.94]|uniref:Uncharacterized protein n=1 Tax=Karstenula rhodostoma CBS 690.94 TaxID=1392251 RepID=A0A9P4PRC0_9PLEO|nr:hypothetical protein P171DRAFT_222600 [Karstenula rhodostoma CBS 690.94]